MNQIINAPNKNLGRVTLAVTLVVSLLALTGGFYFATNKSNAAAVTQFKDTLSTSAPNTFSNHTIQFITQTAIKNSDTIRVDFVSSTPGWVISTLNFNDVDIATSSAGNCASTADENVTGVFGTGPAGSKYAVTVTSSTNTMVITVTSTAGTYIATSSCVVLRIGTNAVFNASGTGQIKNPVKNATIGTADIEQVKVSFTGTAAADTGTALTATIEGVTISVTVDSTLSFTVAGVASGSCTQGGSGTAITTTSTTVPFGSSGIQTNAFYRGCQDLTISTNASSGYAISIEENTNLLSGATTIPDTVCDSGCGDTISSASTTAWATATNNGLGYTCSGTNCNANFVTASEFNQIPCQGSDAQCDPNAGADAKTSPISASAPVSADVNRIVYKLSVSGTQPAGSYSNTVTYIATPTF